MAVTLCRACAVEHAEPLPEVCRICADERQYVPPDGQRWVSLQDLQDDGTRAEVTELEPDLYGVSTDPTVGIGQLTKIVRTPVGNLLWDPIGYLDDTLVSRVVGLGPVAAIVASHPHMYGVQVEWSRALGGVPVLIADADREWVMRPDAAIETWSGTREVLPGITLLQTGGHFPGSACVHWAGGADGAGVLLAGDTIMANPDRVSVSFLRSYPNRIPLSAAVVDRVATLVTRYPFARLYSNFDNVVPADADAIVRRSADRHMAWVGGVFDHLT